MKLIRARGSTGRANDAALRVASFQASSAGAADDWLGLACGKLKRGEVVMAPVDRQCHSSRRRDTRTETPHFPRSCEGNMNSVTSRSDRAWAFLTP